MTLSAGSITARAYIERLAGGRVPGLQYVVVDGDNALFEHAGGWADVGRRTPMTLDTTMMAYSMTKTVTAVAVLQLVEQGKLRLEDEAARHVPGFPYGDGVTVLHLLVHTSGIPNPIPLRWAHLVSEDSAFDEGAALDRVLRAHPRLRSRPGDRFRYSNIGYWLLGRVVEDVTGQRYADYARERILKPLGAPRRAMDFGIPDPGSHAGGYLARRSVMNAMKGFVTDRRLWGGHEGRWLRFESHLLDGPAFGGLVGTARAFALFLQDQLRPQSVLLNRRTRELLRTQQRNNAGGLIPMTPGWHVGRIGRAACLFKEGGGGGFHCEMRLYPSQRIGSVVMTNGTAFDSTSALNHLDAAFFRAESGEG